jgi:hypothetical protein
VIKNEIKNKFTQKYPTLSRFSVNTANTVGKEVTGVREDLCLQERGSLSQSVLSVQQVGNTQEKPHCCTCQEAGSRDQNQEKSDTRGAIVVLLLEFVNKGFKIIYWSGVWL